MELTRFASGKGPVRSAARVVVLPQFAVDTGRTMQWSGDWPLCSPAGPCSGPVTGRCGVSLLSPGSTLSMGPGLHPP
ncbi:hypothetical protein ACOMHN_061198 [Nucella lapillus]